MNILIHSPANFHDIIVNVTIWSYMDVIFCWQSILVSSENFLKLLVKDDMINQYMGLENNNPMEKTKGGERYSWLGKSHLFYYSNGLKNQCSDC